MSSSIPGDWNSGCKCGPILLEWKDCDTLSKQIGFIAGKCIQFTVSNSYQLGKKVVQLFRIDKATSYFFESFKLTVKSGAVNGKKGTESILKLALKCIQPFYTNSIVKTAARFTYENILSPACRAIYKLLARIFKAIPFGSIANAIGSFLSNYIQPIFINQATKSAGSWTIENLGPITRKVTNFVIDYGIIPIGNTIYGIISGSLRSEGPKTDEEQPEIKDL